LRAIIAQLDTIQFTAGAVSDTFARINRTSATPATFERERFVNAITATSSIATVVALIVFDTAFITIGEISTLFAPLVGTNYARCDW